MHLLVCPRTHTMFAICYTVGWSKDRWAGCAIRNPHSRSHHQLLAALHHFFKFLADGRVRPELVILDPILLNGDGAGLCRELRQAGADVPILILTST